jgi:hypothetical protein
MSKQAFLRRIERAAALGQLPERPHRLALLTGQSRLDDSALSAEQGAFLASLGQPQLDIVPRGFPFDQAESAQPAQVPPPLLLAAVRNARQYLWTRTDPRFVALVAAAVQRLADATSHNLVLLTGSSGLALLDAAARQLRLRAGTRLAILAFGPVGRAPADARIAFSAVQGRADRWSRALYAGPVSHRPECGHLDYWRSADCRGIAADFVRAIVS